MILLTAATHKVQIISQAVNGLDVHASWVDLSGGSVSPGSTNTPVITGAGTTDIVAAPAASTQRNVKFLSIRNVHASSSNTITVQHYDGTTTTTLIKFALKAGYTLTYNDQQGWLLFDASGGAVRTPLTGRYLGSSVLTSASANFTTGSETNTLVIRGVGGGGAGGGCTSVSAACSAAGGGGAGGYIEKTVTVSPSTAYAYTCGPAGTGSSGAAGGNGTDSTFVVGATTYTAKGGTGGPQAVSATTLKAFLGGAGGTVSTNGDLNSAGQPGQPGVVLIVNSGTTEVQVSGNGGSGPFGAGGIGRIDSGSGADGVAGIGFGSGGGGAVTGAAQARAGGNGTAGCWVVDEFS